MRARRLRCSPGPAPWRCPRDVVPTPHLAGCIRRPACGRRARGDGHGGAALPADAHGRTPRPPTRRRRDRRRPVRTRPPSARRARPAEHGPAQHAGRQRGRHGLRHRRAPRLDRDHEPHPPTGGTAPGRPGRPDRPRGASAPARAIDGGLRGRHHRIGRPTPGHGGDDELHPHPRAGTPSRAAPAQAPPGLRRSTTPATPALPRTSSTCDRATSRARSASTHRPGSATPGASCTVEPSPSRSMPRHAPPSPTRPGSTSTPTSSRSPTWPCTS